jgi:hypothetical protein
MKVIWLFKYAITVLYKDFLIRHFSVSKLYTDHGVRLELVNN